MGVSLWGGSPLCETGSLKEAVYQMVELRSTKHEVRATAGGRPTVGRKPANALRKCRPDETPPAAFSPRPARRRTETSYKAGSTRRVSQSSRSRSQSVAQVNDALVQGQFTLLSGEICMAFCGRSGGTGAAAAPASRACPKVRNGIAKATPGDAEVSRGHSTAPHIPLRTGRTER